MNLPGPIPLLNYINVSAWANPLSKIYQCICLGQYPCLYLSMYLPGPIPMFNSINLSILFKFINVFAWANPLVEIYQCICLGKCPCLIYQCICLGQSPCLNLSMYLPGPILMSNSINLSAWANALI